jgi:peptidoglycan/LPS O-acetylase OafA/YrhL
METFTLVYFVIALAVGALVYYWIEAPARNWSSSLASRIGRGEIRWRFPPLAR